MSIKREPLIRRLYEEPAPTANTLCRELTLALNTANVLNHRVAEHDIEIVGIETCFASITNNVSCPFRFIAMFIYVKNRDFGTLRNHCPVKGTATHIQHCSASIDRKTLAENGHATSAEALEDGPIELMNIHWNRILSHYFPIATKLNM